jgi:hypothetical protein
MAKNNNSTEHTTFKFRHRAVCEDDNFRSSWFDDISEAQQAAQNHRQQAGNEDHVIRIVTEQTISTLFRGI